MKLGSKIALGVLGLGVAIQLVPLDRSNPPVSGDVEAPPDVKAVLRRACYDCHSNETVWPWYSRVAPVSWLVHSDVTEGRSHVNFSEWNRLSASQRSKKQRAAGHEVGEGEMPLWYYLPMHPHARLSAADKQLIVAWGGGGGNTEEAGKDDDD